MNPKIITILQITQEECAEVIQSVAKIFRFGLDDSHEGKSNKQRLESELGDLQCMIDLLKEHGVVDADNIDHASKIKRQKLHKWSNIFNS